MTMQEIAAAGQHALERVWDRLQPEPDTALADLLMAASFAVEDNTVIVEHPVEPGRRAFNAIQHTSPQFVATALNRRAIDCAMPGALRRNWWALCPECDDTGCTWNDEDGHQPCTCAAAPAWAR